MITGVENIKDFMDRNKNKSFERCGKNAYVVKNTTWKYTNFKQKRGKSCEKCPKILNKHLLTFGGFFAIVKMCLNKNKNAQNKNKNQKQEWKLEP